jgi:hypothetical protein
MKKFANSCQSVKKEWKECSKSWENVPKPEKMSKKLKKCAQVDKNE